MKPINIYIQSRIKDVEDFNSVHRHISAKPKNSNTKEHEISSLKLLVDRLIKEGITLEAFDGFFFGYSIPKIGKEFDLLKFEADSVLNIELKSQKVPINQIEDQLLRNRYYLSHLGTNNLFYTVETSSMTCFKLQGEKAKKVSIKELSLVVESFCGEFLDDISTLFRESDYSVSPFDTPEKFINGEYFLTGAQEQIRNKILQSIKKTEKSGFFSIKGMPGTGKTLLLYDTAKELAILGKTLVIHVGKIGEVKYTLSNGIENFNICDTDDLEETLLDVSKYQFVLVDDAQSMNKCTLNTLIDLVKNQKSLCIFSSAPDEILTTVEKSEGSAEIIKSVSNLGVYELSEKIRSNKDIYAFISVLKCLTRKDDFNTDYADVEVSFASNEDEAYMICSYYKSKRYTFINYGRNTESEKISSLEEVFDESRIIGAELKKTVILMDNSFYYDFSGWLEGIPQFNPDRLYPNPFYSSITRIRDKLAVVVLGDYMLFSKISGILKGK